MRKRATARAARFRDRLTRRSSCNWRLAASSRGEGRPAVRDIVQTPRAAAIVAWIGLRFAPGKPFYCFVEAGTHELRILALSDYRSRMVGMTRRR
jgi:hypothetical protein